MGSFYCDESNHYNVVDKFNAYKNNKALVFFIALELL